MWYFFSALKAALERKRVCRRCGRSQMARPGQTGKPPVCKYCGGELEPPKKGS